MDQKEVKFVIIGDSGVGKSTLTHRYTTGKFDEKIVSTIGIDFKMKQIMHKNEKYKVKIWDTAGQERYRTITNNYYRSSEGIIFTYSVTDKKSFQSVKNWLSECALRINLAHIEKILVGTKCDNVAQRQVSYDEGEYFARTHGLKFFETSAKTGQDVDKAFDELVNMVVESRELPKNQSKLTQESNKNKIIKPVKPEKPHQSSWCIIL